MIKNSKGFSLIELAIVLAVIALFVGGAINTYGRWIEKQYYEEAIEDIEQIKKAVIGFSISNGYLPCSDFGTLTAPGDGIENRNAGDCFIPAGNVFRTVPYATLGVERLDPWGNPYGYHAAANYSDSNAPFTLATGAAAACPSANCLQINDGAAPLSVIANQVAFIVYSLGPDRGQSTSQQDENLQVGGASDDLFSKADTFIPLNVGANSGFDDIVSWVSTNVVKLYMLEAEQLPRN